MYNVHTIKNAAGWSRRCTKTVEYRIKCIAHYQIHEITYVYSAVPRPIGFITKPYIAPWFYQNRFTDVDVVSNNSEQKKTQISCKNINYIPSICLEIWFIHVYHIFKYMFIRIDVLVQNTTNSIDNALDSVKPVWYCPPHTRHPYTPIP